MDRLRNIRDWYRKKFHQLSQPMDRTALSLLYQDIIHKMPFFGIFLWIAYTPSVMLEYFDANWINFWISFCQVLVSIVVGSVYWIHKKSENWAFYVSTVAMVAIALLEIESSFHDPHNSWLDARNYLAFIALLGVWTFFYPGPVGKFIKIWMVLFLIFLLRVGWETDFTIPWNFLKDMTTIIPLTILFFFLNYWWFQIRYLAAYRGVLLEAKSMNLVRDIHDNVGSYLTDLMISIENAKKKGASDRATWEKIEAIAKKATRNLRKEVHDRDDDQILESCFVDGIRLVLHRRYQNSGRAVRFSVQDPRNEKDAFQVPEDWLSHWKSLFLEISNNDLKYGFGTAHWYFDFTEIDALVLTFQAHTNDDPAVDRHLGLGNRSIQQRLDQINARYQMDILPIDSTDPNTAKLFQLKIVFPRARS